HGDAAVHGGAGGLPPPAPGAAGARAQHHGHPRRVQGVQAIQPVPVGDEGVRRDQLAAVDVDVRPGAVQRRHDDAGLRRRRLAPRHQERAAPPLGARLLRPQEGEEVRRRERRHAVPGHGRRRQHHGERQGGGPGGQELRLLGRHAGRQDLHRHQGGGDAPFQVRHPRGHGAHRVRRPLRHPLHRQPHPPPGARRLQGLRVAGRLHGRAQDVRGRHGQGPHPVRRQRRRLPGQGRARRQGHVQGQPHQAPPVPRPAFLQHQDLAQVRQGPAPHAGRQGRRHGGRQGRRRLARHRQEQVPRRVHRRRQRPVLPAHHGHPPGAAGALRRRPGGGTGAGASGRATGVPARGGRPVGGRGPRRPQVQEAVGVVRRRVATGRRARRGGRVLRRAGLPLVMHCCLTAPPTSASSDPSRYPFLCDLSPPLCSGPCFIESVGALPFPHVI
uniref:Uncharacterized protein n=1 Tax=Zea mays TaxID=4577 RepID=A0A804LCV0_MAIZE